MILDKDYAAVLVSSICIVHCLAGPVILALGFTSVGFSFLSDERIHLVLVFPIILLAAWSIPNGFRVHKKIFPVIAAITGVVLLVLGLMIERFEMILTFSASSLLIFAHVSNKKLLRHA